LEIEREIHLVNYHIITEEGKDKLIMKQNLGKGLVGIDLGNPIKTIKVSRINFNGWPY